MSVLHSLTAGPCTQSPVQHHMANICLFLFLNIGIVFEDLTGHHSKLEVSERDQIYGEKMRLSTSLENNSHFDMCQMNSSPDHQNPSSEFLPLDLIRPPETQAAAPAVPRYPSSAPDALNLGVLFSCDRSCCTSLHFLSLVSFLTTHLSFVKPTEGWGETADRCTT